MSPAVETALSKSRGLRLGVEMISAGTSIEEGEGGAGGYYAGLIPGLCADARVADVVAYTADWYEPATHWRHPKLRVQPCNVPRSRALRVLYEQLVIPLKVQRDGVDVLLSLANIRPLVRRGPNVVVLHAVQHFLFGRSIGRMRSAYLRFAVPRSTRTADRVVTVSETLREDAIRLFDLDPDRVVTVRMGPPPWADDLRASAATAEPYRTPTGRPYVLCISRLYEHKNHRRLIDAFALATASGDLPHELLIVGGDAEVTSEELAAHAAAVGLADRVNFLGRVPQDMVASLYAGAAMVAYVSLYETFGLPVLEAFASGCPLLTSAHGATPEIAADGALCVDPTDVEAIASGLRSILLDDELGGQLVAAGRARIAEFTWGRCAQETIDAVMRVGGEANESRKWRG
jgi:glycosyltransferase involved in cell wall biosynthesis